MRGINSKTEQTSPSHKAERSSCAFPPPVDAAVKKRAVKLFRQRKSNRALTVSFKCMLCHLQLKKETRGEPFGIWLQRGLKVSRVAVAASWDKVFQFLCAFLCV